MAKNDLGSNGSPFTSVTKGDALRTWTISYQWPEGANKYIGWDSNNGRGVQVGSGSDTNKCNSLVLTTTGFGKVNRITIGANTASSGNALLSVTVGGQTMKINDATSIKLNATATPTSYTFTSDSPLDGDIVITITNSASKALYLKSISINK